MNLVTAFAPMPLIAKRPSLDELVKRLGDIPLSRILIDPVPGTATEADV